jgi:hypothetical protein
VSAKETERKGSGGAGAFVSDVKELRRRARSHIEQGAVTAGYRADRATRGAPDLIPESCTGSGGNEHREGAAAAVSLHDTVGLTTLGGNGLHRPRGSQRGCR